MTDFKSTGAIFASLLFLFCAFGFVSNDDFHAQVKAEEHAAHIARNLWLKDAGREREDMKDIALKAQYAEIGEQWKGMKK